MKNNASLNDNSKYLLITSKEKDNNIRSNLSKTHPGLTDNYRLKTDSKVLTLVNDKSHISNDGVYKIKNLIWNKNLNKHNSTATKEWTNSVYTYNKNYAKPLPIARNTTSKLLTSYFNISSLIGGNKSNSKAIIEKRTTLDKTLVSKADVKITADKVNLTIYIYNRNKETLLYRFNQLIRSNNISLSKLYRVSKNNKNNKKAYAKLKKFTTEGIFFIRDIRKFKDKLVNQLAKPFNFKNNDLKVETPSTSISRLLTKTFSDYELKYFSDYIDAIYTKEMLYLYYVREIVVNNNIFKNWFLLGLKKTLSKLYNKKVELNIVNQKYFYLNSDIFINALTTRLKNRNNRVTNVIRSALNCVTLAKFNKHIISGPTPYMLNSDNSRLLELNNDNLKDKILQGIKYKHIQGVRIEAAGRLTPRLTASRSLSKLDFRGNLKNNDAINTINDFTLLRGSVKPNLQYTLLNSKTRNGTFGLKGWVSSN